MTNGDFMYQTIWIFQRFENIPIVKDMVVVCVYVLMYTYVVENSRLFHWSGSTSIFIFNRLAFTFCRQNYNSAHGDPISEKFAVQTPPVKLGFRGAEGDEEEVSWLSRCSTFIFSLMLRACVRVLFFFHALSFCQFWFLLLTPHPLLKCLALHRGVKPLLSLLFENISCVNVSHWNLQASVSSGEQFELGILAQDEFNLATYAVVGIGDDSQISSSEKTEVWGVLTAWSAAPYCGGWWMQLVESILLLLFFCQHFPVSRNQGLQSCCLFCMYSRTSLEYRRSSKSRRHPLVFLHFQTHKNNKIREKVEKSSTSGWNGCM